MTHDTMETIIVATQSTNPQATVLSIGLAGLPSTHWPLGASLTVALQAQGLQKLFAHLTSRGSWNPREHGSAVFVAFDVGGHICKCQPLLLKYADDTISNHRTCCSGKLPRSRKIGRAHV